MSYLLTKEAERFWAKVQIGAKDECWPWRGCRNSKGYGRFNVNGKITQAHNTALRTKAEPPDGKPLGHI